MSRPAPIEDAASIEDAPPPAAAGASWLVRSARGDDIAAVAGAVEQLLLELGGSRPPLSAMEETVRCLLEDRHAGTLLVAQARDAIVGVLAASWQTAIHVPGRYALIQDLWVHPSWRSKAVGADLLVALCELARERRIARIEVGLPQDAFPAIRATQAFYLANGFSPLGERMRRVIS